MPEPKPERAVPELAVDGIHKRLGQTDILKGVTLTLAPGEVVSLLGHSGSGKTTILRCVAGLERPDRGRITLRDRTVFDAERGIETPPEQRGLGMVFQSYALWPNRTVRQNVGYGLKLRGERALDEKVDEVLAKLGLGALGERYPHQLSGGQQQRVALARALVYRPPVLLLDEPLSNLDAKLREEARSWVRELIVQSRISALYVTHDQVEAMAVSDRVVLLNGGAIEQEGAPHAIYAEPRTAMAAEFMGSNNRLNGTIGAVDGDHARLDTEGGTLWGRRMGPLAPGAAAKGFVRIERTRLATGPGEGRLPVVLESSLYLGERWEYVLSRNGVRLRAWGPAAEPPGERWVEFNRNDLWLFA
jgi:iron(III) transport system ATP-binding protein